MDDFIGGFKKISDFYIRDSEGNYINIKNGEFGDLKMDNDFGVVKPKKREEMLVELQEKLETMNNAVSDLQYLVDEELHDGEKDENMDLKTIIKLNRIDDELATCYDLIIEDNL